MDNNEVTRITHDDDKLLDFGFEDHCDDSFELLIFE